MHNFNIFKTDITEIISKKLKIKIAFVIAFISELINKCRMHENTMNFDYYDIGNIALKIEISIKKAKLIFHELIEINFIKIKDKNIFIIRQTQETIDQTDEKNNDNQQLTKKEKRRIQICQAQARFRQKKDNQQIIMHNQNIITENNQKVITNNQKNLSSSSLPSSPSLSPTTPISPALTHPSSPLNPLINTPKGDGFSLDFSSKNNEKFENKEEINENGCHFERHNGKIIHKSFNHEASVLKGEANNNPNKKDNIMHKNDNYPKDFENLWNIDVQTMYKSLNRDAGSKQKAFKRWKLLIKSGQKNDNIKNSIMTCTTAIKLVEKKQCSWFSVKEFDKFLNSKDETDKKRWLHWFKQYQKIEEIKNEERQKREEKTLKQSDYDEPFKIKNNHSDQQFEKCKNVNNNYENHA